MAVSTIVSTHAFEAIGTHWHITVEATEAVPQETWQKVQDRITAFDQRFSRFILSSEANAWRTAESGSYAVSAEMAALLQFAADLRRATNGKFDPAVGGLLELAGYDPSYSFTEKSQLTDWKTPGWDISGNILTIDAPLVIDVGGYGKGTCIDLTAEILRAAGWQYFLIDGGGDLYGTTKLSGDPWQVAVEWPGKPEYALSQVALSNQALAVSDIFKRNWGDWHHVIDPDAAKPASQVLGIAVLGPDAQTADGLTTAIALVPAAERATLAQRFKVEFVLLTANQTTQTSHKWPGVLFIE